MTQKRPIKLCSFGGYRRFSSGWWADLLWWTTGVRPWIWGRPGWWADIMTAYHRMRYGWAPSDTWNLDDYFLGVMVDSLEHLAQTTNSYPANIDRLDVWQQMLRSWANDLRWIRDFDLMDVPLQFEETMRRYAERDERLRRVFDEMLPWWHDLWN